MTEILSVFAGLGKTTAAKKYAEVCDLQSSSHRYLGGVNQDYEKIKMNSSLPDNPDWPINYLRAIRGGQWGNMLLFLCLLIQMFVTFCKAMILILRLFYRRKQIHSEKDLGNYMLAEVIIKL